MKLLSTGLALLVMGLALALPQAANAISSKCKSDFKNCHTDPTNMPEAFVPKEVEPTPAAVVPTDEDLLNLEPKPAEQRT